MKLYPSLIFFCLIFCSVFAFSQNHTSLKLRADSLYKAEKFELARKAYDAFLAHDSSSAEAFHRRGACYLNEEMLALAKRDFLQALEIDSLYANSYYNLGLIENEKENYEKGLKYFKQYNKLEKADYEGLMNVAVNYVYLDEADSFDVYFQRAHLLDSTDIRLYQIGATDYAYFGDFEQAESLVLKAISLFPSIPDFYELAVEIYSEQDKHDKTLEVAVLGRKQFPDDISWVHEVALNRILANTSSDILKIEEGKSDKFSHISAGKTGLMDKWVNNKKGNYYYHDLVEKFESHPDEMGFDDYFMLYYGKSEQKEYSPYGPDIEIKLYQEMMAEEQYDKALTGIKEGLKGASSNIDLYYLAAGCYANLGDLEKFEQTIQHYYGFALGILYTGDGLSYESAFIVTSTHDEYTIMELLDREVSGQALEQHEGHSFDILTSGEGERKQEIYFNIDKPFRSLGEMFGGKKKRKN